MVGESMMEASLIDVVKIIFNNSLVGAIVVNKNEVLWINESANQILRDDPEGEILKICYEIGTSINHVEMADKGIVIEYTALSNKANIALVMICSLKVHEKLKTENSLYKEMLNSVQDALYVVDSNGKELFYNKNIERFDSQCREDMLNELMSVFQTGEPIIEKYRRYLTKDHKGVHLITSCFPVKRDGKIVAAYSINNFVTKLKQLLEHAVDLQNQLQRFNKSGGKNINGTNYSFKDIIGDSKIIRNTIDMAKKMSLSNAPVLIYGETGTGKELFAQSIHNYSNSKKEPFVAVNCAAIPDTLLESLLFGTTKGAFTGSNNTIGLFEQSGYGTLFLDEISDMDPNLQAKLLRVIQERCFRKLGGDREVMVNCRIISSTNRDPVYLMDRGCLRKDLFYRIAVATVAIPPLRERKEDILPITVHYLKEFNKVYGKNVTAISEGLKETLLSHSWPGNVRELTHLLQGALHLMENEKVLSAEYLPDYFCCQKTNQGNTQVNLFLGNNIGDKSDDFCLSKHLREVEKSIILKVLEKNKGNLTQSANQLGIQRQSLQAKMKKLYISKSIKHQ
jgi:arginine utilization regulatory protein